MNTSITQNFNKDITAGNVKSAMKSVDAKSRDLYYVPITALSVMDDFNVRSKNDEYNIAVREIADSIKANGFYPHKPFAVLVMKENGSEVLAIYDGHTRFDGLKLAISEGAAVERVPVVCAPQGTTLEDITVGLVTNNSGRQLEPMGLAIVIKRLVGYGLDNLEISKRLGFTVSYVGGLLSLIGAPKIIRDMVSEGKVSASLAVSAMRDHSENAVTVLQAGMVKANESGKAKLTAKNMPRVETKRAKEGVKIAVKSTQLQIGLDWIKENGGDERAYSMLCAMTGMTIGEIYSAVE